MPVTGHVVELVDPGLLDQHKAGELEGNRISLDVETVRHYLDKENWSSFIQHFTERKIARLASWLVADRVDDAAFLGSGTGFEIGPLVRHGFAPRVLALSDLSRSTLEVAKYNLAQSGIAGSVPVSLFTSDLDEVPIKSREQPLVIYECLHHTADMHAAIERMLKYGYQQIYFVEPSTNWVIESLAKRGLAQRIEYSGVDPDRLNIKLLKSLCRENGYRLDVHTLWEFPDDYFRRFLRKFLRRERSTIVERGFHLLIDTISIVGRPFRFGNFAVCRLTKEG
jgi:hypothetical protein